MASHAAAAAAAALPDQPPPCTVVAEDTGACYVAQPGHRIFFDDAAGCLHVCEGRLVTTVALPGSHDIPPASCDASPAPGEANQLFSSPERRNVTGFPVALTTATSNMVMMMTPPISSDSVEEESGADVGVDEYVGLVGTSTPRQQHGLSGEPSPASASSTAAFTPPQNSSPGPRRHRPLLHVRSESAVSNASVSSATSRTFLASPGPEIAAIRSSPDGSATALQRSRVQIEILDHNSGNLFVETPRTRGADLHGFFWLPDYENTAITPTTPTHSINTRTSALIMVTTAGIEAFTLHAQSLRPATAQRLHAVQWFVWSHPARLLILGCGSVGAKLTSFQFGPRGALLRLPLLDLAPPWGSPMKSPAAPRAPWLLVVPSQVWSLIVRRRVFTAFHDGEGGGLRLYRVYRDCTVLTAEVSVSASVGKLAVSVVDHVIVLHSLVDGSVQLVDLESVMLAKKRAVSGGGPSERRSTGTLSNVATMSSMGGGLGIEPLCPPTPLGMILDSTCVETSSLVGDSSERIVASDDAAAVGVHASKKKSDEDPGGDEEAATTPIQLRGREEGQRLCEASENDEAALREDQSHVAFSECDLFHPDWAVDTLTGCIKKLKLNLEAVADVGRDPIAVLSFLQRRRSSPVPWRDPRHVTLRLLRRIVAARESPAVVRAALDAIFIETAAMKPKGKQEEGGPSLGVGLQNAGMMLLSPEEIALSIFAPLLDDNERHRPGRKDDGEKERQQRAEFRSPTQGSSTPRDQTISDTGSVESTVLHAAAANDSSAVGDSGRNATYVQAYIAELLASCYCHGLEVSPAIGVLYVRAYVAREQSGLLSALLRSHAQVLDSMGLVERLEEDLRQVDLAREMRGRLQTARSE